MADEEMLRLLHKLGLLGAYLRLADPSGRMRRAGSSEGMAQILAAYRRRMRKKRKKELLKAIREGKL